MASVSPIPTTGLRGRGVSSPGNVDTQFNVASLANLYASSGESRSLTIQADAISTDIATSVAANNASLNPVAGWLATAFNVADNSLDTLAGNDNLSATGAAIGAYGIKIGQGVMDLGAGNDRLNFVFTGSGSIGMENTGGTFKTGAGIDVSTFDAGLTGLINGSLTSTNAKIDTGAGADKIVASGLTGSGVVNYGTINMGAELENDKDVLTGTAGPHLTIPVASYTPATPGIYNSGTINMGGGKDVIDALTGGFTGGGTYNLGSGLDADAVLGFGDGTFNGGGGRNGITLPAGTYHVTYTVAPVDVKSPASGSITMDGQNAVMNFNQFDSIGGTGPIGQHFAFVDALGALTKLTTLVVNPDGSSVPTFQ